MSTRNTLFLLTLYCKCLICWGSQWWWWWKFYGMKKILFLFCHNILCHILNWIQRLWKSYFKRVLLSSNSIIHFTIEFFSTNFYSIQYILFNMLFVEDSFIINFALKTFLSPTSLPTEYIMPKCLLRIDHLFLYQCQHYTALESIGLHYNAMALYGNAMDSTSS